MLDFEGFKKIKNEKNYTLEDLYKILSPFEGETGKITVLEDAINLDVDGKYLIEVSLRQDQIVIQRKIEENKTEDNIDLGNEAKTIDMSMADRMIEQIHDLIVSTMEGRKIEKITNAKKVYFLETRKSTFSNIFVINDEYGNPICQAKENKILQEYKIKNEETKMELATVKYTGAEFRKYAIALSSYNSIDINIDNSNVKTLFTGTVDTKKLVAKADYTDNHYNIELADIVIGAIDYLSDTKQYRIEINDTNHENLLMALAIIVNLQCKNKIN